MDEIRVRRFVASYIAGEITLADLDREIAPLAWAVGASPDLRELVNAVELRIDEFSSGACDEQQLRDSLRPFLTGYTVSVNFGSTTPIVQHASASSVVSGSPVSVRSTTVDTGRAVAFA